jgi:hypothetical protein
MRIPPIAESPVNWIKIPLMAALGLIGVSILLRKFREGNLGGSAEIIRS